MICLARILLYFVLHNISNEKIYTSGFFSFCCGFERAVFFFFFFPHTRGARGGLCGLCAPRSNSSMPVLHGAHRPRARGGPGGMVYFLYYRAPTSLLHLVYHFTF